jgi:hypothetical protein
MIVSMTLGHEWGLDKKMTLAEPSVHDFDMKEEILKDIDFEHVDSSLIRGLVLLLGEIRVVPPPWIVRLRIWAT